MEGFIELLLRLLLLFFGISTPLAQQPSMSERTIRGVVTENNLGCTVDAACFLQLQTGASSVTVVYHYGEWPPCDNQAAAAAGLQVTAGASVEVFASLEDDGSLSTCAQADYYIRAL